MDLDRDRFADDRVISGWVGGGFWFDRLCHYPVILYSGTTARHVDPGVGATISVDADANAIPGPDPDGDGEDRDCDGDAERSDTVPVVPVR